MTDKTNDQPQPTQVMRPSDYDVMLTDYLQMLPAFALDMTLLWREGLPNGAEIVQLVQGMLTE
jgi:hypothetical protein